MRLRTSFRRETAPEDLAHLHEVLSAAGACGDAGKTAQDDRAIYQPFQLMSRKIILSDETLGAISQFEIFASRCDCTIGTSPLGPSLSRTLARMDGIFVALLNGARADYRTCCFLDYLKEAGGWTKGTPDKARVEAIMGSTRLDREVLEASRCAHQMMAIEINSLCGAAPATITPRYVLALHQAISRTFHPGAPTGLRGWEVNDKDSEGLGRAYRPPSPLELPEFLQDLVMFLNNSKLGPSAKVALMHYQMEATKMFDTDIDQLARALLVGIWRNANLITHIMAPIAITPALAQRNHDEVLQPYQFCCGTSETQMIDEWVYHTARASRNVQLQFGLSRHRKLGTSAKRRETLYGDDQALSHFPRRQPRLFRLHPRGIHRHNLHYCGKAYRHRRESGHCRSSQSRTSKQGLRVSGSHGILQRNYGRSDSMIAISRD